MDPVYDNASSDAQAILICLSALAVFAHDADRLAIDGTVLAEGKTIHAKETGTRIRDNAAAALKLARERLDVLMEDFGEFFNGGDACSATMESVTEPVYAVLRKRKSGISLND